MRRTQNDPRGSAKKARNTSAAGTTKARKTATAKTVNAGAQARTASTPDVRDHVDAVVPADRDVAVSGPQQITSRIHAASAEAQAHRSAMRTSFPDIASYLQEVLGQRLTAHIADVGDPQTVGRWIKGGRKPRADSEQRVVAAYQIFQLLLSEESPQTIRAWFLGLNPALGDTSPAQAIRDGHFKQTMGAARAFVIDS